MQDKKLRERQLLNNINLTVSDNFKVERYHYLSKKLQLGKVSNAEHSELAILANSEEKMRNQRVKYMIELSQIREVSLSQVMKSLGLTPIAPD